MPDYLPPEPAERDRVLRAYLRDGRLHTMPRAGRRRWIVLGHLVQRFEPGVKYDETEINLALRQAHDDVAALRRYLVDEGMLSRDHGVYWRSGGDS